MCVSVCVCVKNRDRLTQNDVQILSNRNYLQGIFARYKNKQTQNLIIKWSDIQQVRMSTQKNASAEIITLFFFLPLNSNHTFTKNCKELHNV